MSTYEEELMRAKGCFDPESDPEPSEQEIAAIPERLGLGRRSDWRCTCGHNYLDHVNDVCLKLSGILPCPCFEFEYAERRMAMSELERLSLSRDAGRDLTVAQAHQFRLRRIHTEAVELMIRERK